jgi:hypothetical protein
LLVLPPEAPAPPLEVEELLLDFVLELPPLALEELLPPLEEEPPELDVADVLPAVLPPEFDPPESPDEHPLDTAPKINANANRPDWTFMECLLRL